MKYIQFVRKLPGARVPSRSTDRAGGYDLHAILPEGVERFTLAPGQRHKIETGIAIALSHQFVAWVTPRSGLADKHGVTVLNAPGLVDEDFRGSIKVVLINHGDEPFHVLPGDRIAQLVITGIATPAFVEVESLDATARGDGGFGSTGVSAITSPNGGGEIAGPGSRMATFPGESVGQLYAPLPHSGD